MTLYREIDALGGGDDRSYSIAITRALGVLERRGFTEQADAQPPCYDRLVALAEHAAVSASGYTQDEARAIMAELRPVDPVMLKARELRLACSPDPDPDYVRYMNEGAYDQSDEVQRYVTAIRFGMTLSESGK